jgi:hypothetical protein
MKLLDKYIYFFTGVKVRKTCLLNHPSLILKLPPIQLHFAKTTLVFFHNYKNTLFTCTLNFQKLHIKIHKLYTNKHILHTNNNVPSLQLLELSHSTSYQVVSVIRLPMRYTRVPLDLFCFHPIVHNSRSAFCTI